jgi:hypothetical protein
MKLSDVKKQMQAEQAARDGKAAELRQKKRRFIEDIRKATVDDDAFEIDLDKSGDDFIVLAHNGKSIEVRIDDKLCANILVDGTQVAYDVALLADVLRAILIAIEGPGR